MKPDKETPEQRTVRVARAAQVYANNALRKRCLIEIGKLKKKRGGLNTYISKRGKQLEKMAEELEKKEDELDVKRNEESAIDDEIIALADRLDEALFEIEYGEGEEEVDYSVDWREHTTPYDPEILNSLLAQRDDTPLESTKPVSALADSFTEATEPTFTLPPDCHPQVKANCEEMLKSDVSEKMISEILDNWWFYEDSSAIYSDCIYYLYEVDIPARLLEFKERVALKMQLAQHINTGAK
jgi:hypothetical protein